MTKPSEYYDKKDFGNVVKQYSGRKGIYSDNGQLLLEDGTYPNTVYVDGSNDGWVRVSELEELLEATIIPDADLPPAIDKNDQRFFVDEVLYYYADYPDTLEDHYLNVVRRNLAALKEVKRHRAAHAALEAQRVAEEEQRAYEAEKRAQVAKIKQALIHEGGIQTLGAEAIAENLYEAGIRPVD